MPVEESANMLIMAGAYLARIPAAQRAAYATAHYPILKQWADYLVANALDPNLQNQTDDFTGFIAHSVNLALKGIIGIGAFSQIATLAGNSADAASYLATAKDYIGQWQTKAQDVSGKHLKLAYDQDGTWSLKYNGYADRLLKTRPGPELGRERGGRVVPHPPGDVRHPARPPARLHQGRLGDVDGGVAQGPPRHPRRAGHRPLHVRQHDGVAGADDRLVRHGRSTGRAVSRPGRWSAGSSPCSPSDSGRRLLTAGRCCGVSSTSVWRGPRTSLRSLRDTMLAWQAFST